MNTDDITIPRGIPRRNFVSTILTAQNQVEFCRAHSLPNGEARALRQIERCNKILALIDAKALRDREAAKEAAT